MKLKFKKQAYQTAAVNAVVDCFKGQLNISGIQYRIDPGKTLQPKLDDSGFKNADVILTEEQLLENIQQVQRNQNLNQSSQLIKSKISPINLDVEMETGTGKTYCYLKTMFEMNKRYGWSKFIVVVPSIAIREGVYKTIQITADHFLEEYGTRAKAFIYNSKDLHNIEAFSSDAGINIMVINTQAFNATGKDARRIYEELDDFQSRRPIDVISANRPIVILDEPQKMGDTKKGSKTLDALAGFRPLMILRYSATHKNEHNKVHRLDALDAYNQKLVKKIAVRGIAVKGLSGTNAYMYLESIDISKHAPVARLELEVRQNNGIKRITKRVEKGDDLYQKHSNHLEQYKGYVVSEIDARTDTVYFTNGLELKAGEAVGNVNEAALRRIQIREAIIAHLEKEKALFDQGIKVLSLFFIDEVAKYRLYDEHGQEQSGEYAKIFEEEYQECLSELEGLLGKEEYLRYLHRDPVSNIHNGYFSIDKKSKRLVDPAMSATEKKNDESNDVDAYDLILKDKERLLSLEEPTRFIFSHSALREGWDNPNVFVICTLKHSDNTISRRQEVGRGLRIAVNQNGERQDNPTTVHKTNVLTVVASESYKDFVAGLQKDISEALSERPRIADAKFFMGKVLQTETGPLGVNNDIASGIEFYLIQNGYVDRMKKITPAYHEAVKNQTLSPLPDDLEPYREEIFKLVNSVFSEAMLPDFEDERTSKTNPLNANFERKEFKELWNRINKKAVYSVCFDSQELIDKCVKELDANLRVTPMLYTIQAGNQIDDVSYEQLKQGAGFKVENTRTEAGLKSVHSAVQYDLVGKLVDNANLTRKTVTEILCRINKVTFDQFKMNPEGFISEVSRLINEQKATLVVEHLSYNPLSEKFDTIIFADAQAKQQLKQAGKPLQKHIYDYIVTDSTNERAFVDELDTSNEVVLYAKLPKGFFIPTPVGDYNPDWAIAFKEGVVKHIYFVAETKGSMSSLQLRKVEETKIECARRFFDEINSKINPDNVKYDVVDSYSKLMEIVGVKVKSPTVPNIS